MKKWIIRITALLLSLLFLLFLCGYYLLGTQSGTDFLVAQAQKQLDGSLQIGSATGKILDRLELSNVMFENQAGRAELTRLVLDWKTTDLLRFHLHILELTADDISYIVLSQSPMQEPEPEDKGPPVLPDLKLPITITIEQLGINNFVFSTAPETDPLTVDHAGLALLWNKNGIQLQNLQLSMPQGVLQGQGKVKPMGDYPLQLSTTLETKSPDLPALKLVGTYSGDLQKLVVEEQLTGDIRAELQVTLEQILGNLSWQGDLEIKELVPATFSPEVPGTLKGKIKTSGNLQETTIAASLNMCDDDAPEVNWDAELDLQADLKTLLVNINHLTLKHAELPAQIALSGTAAGQQLDLALDWQELQWPLDEQAEYSSTKGAARLTGSVDDYHLSLNADIAGSQIPAGTIRLNVDGNRESAENLQLTIDVLEGILGVQGNVQWAPAMTWQLSTDGNDINPGAHYEEWPGKLHWLIKTQGRVEEEGVVADVTLDQMEGELRELPIAGSGEIHLKPENILIDDLRLSSGKAVLTAKGELSSDSRMDWQAEIPDFADLLPQAGGSLSATGSVLGEMSKPQLTLKLAASSVAFQETSLERLQADASLDLSWAKPFSLKLSGTNLKAGGNLVRQLGLEAQGTMEDHTAQLKASHDLVDLSLGLQGGYLQDEEQWQGALEQLDISSPDLSNWRLAERTSINGGTKAAALDRMCLKRQDTAICLDGSWDAENTNTGGNIEISGFPLAYLSPWFPETLTELTGVFSLKASASMKEQLQADVKAAISPGSIGYRTVKNEGSLPHEGVKLDLHVAENAVDADIFLSIDSNTIKAELSSPDLLKKDVGSRAKISGNLLIDAGKFDLAEALVPEIEELDVAVNSDFKIQGTLEQPLINGDGRFHIAHILIPDAGLELTDTDFDIKAGNKKIKINGTLNSPEGSLTLDGGVVLDSSQNWPAHFTLKGENFRLINLPEIQIFLTPDLLLEKKDLISLTGDVTIPKADILLRELPEGSETVSPDVVIIQEEQEEKDTSPVQMDLKVTLGNDVHFAGLGVNAFIDGQLSITAEPEEQMLGSGEFHIKEGSYRAYGQDLEILTGIISFPGGPLTQPGINLRAVRIIGEIVAGIYAIGPAAKPRITTFSNPPMSESNVISYLLTGSSPNDPSSGTKLSIGRQINNKLSVSVGTDVKTGESEFITRYRLNRKMHIQTTSATNSNAADVFYTVELGQKEEKVEESASLKKKTNPAEK